MSVTKVVGSILYYQRHAQRFKSVRNKFFRRVGVVLAQAHHRRCPFLLR